MSYLPQILFHYPEFEKHREVIIGSQYVVHKDQMIEDAWAKLRDLLNRPEKYNIREFAGQQLCLLASPALTAQSNAMRQVLNFLTINHVLFD